MHFASQLPHTDVNIGQTVYTTLTGVGLLSVTPHEIAYHTAMEQEVNERTW